MYCQSCGAREPTHKVFFVQHIGVVIVFFHKRIGGSFCRRCVNKYFSEYFFTTLFLGWWGAISIFATPVVLIIDLVNYIPAVAALRPRREKSPTSKTAVRDTTPPASLEGRFTRAAFAIPGAVICPAPKCQRPLRLPPDAHGMLRCRSCGNTFTWRDRARAAKQTTSLVLIAVILGVLLLWVRHLVVP